MTDLPQLSIALLGQPCLTITPLANIVLGNRKALALLAYLAVEGGQTHSRENIVGLLWPDLPNADARNNLRFTWSHLTTKLNQAQATTSEPYLISTRLSLQFNPSGAVWLDVCEFQKLLATCEAHANQHARRNTCDECAQRLARAARLYRSTFLDGLSLEDCSAFDEWQFVQRERFHLQMMELLDDLTQFHERCGQHSQAEHYARRQIELDPLHENAYRQLMRLLDRQCQRTAALAQFEQCQKMLANDLGVEPDAETVWLYRRILAGEVIAPAPNIASPNQLVQVGQPAHNRATGLPVALTPFIGREDELRQMRSRMAAGAYRLFTLVGAGGMGKTRLAVQLARDHAQQYAHGVCFVSLASLQQPGDLPDALAAALSQTFGFSFTDTQQPLWQQVLAALRERTMLLVLDNFETVLHANTNSHTQSAIDFVLDLLRYAPGLHLIVTTREQLNLQAEDLFSLSGLTVPNAEVTADVSKFSAVRMFCDRAYRVNKTFKLTAENATAVIRICQWVQGSPLGIELAAAWLADMRIDELATALVGNLDLLETQLGDMPPQHRSMRGVFEQSWRMLSADERKLLCQLSVFRGGFGLAAATAVTGTSPITLTRLRYKSLVQTSGNGRYDLHELLRQYVMEHLACDENLALATHQKHSEFYLGFVAACAAALVGQHPRKAQTEIREALDNVRDAWRWAIANSCVEKIQHCTQGLALFYHLSGLYSECERVFTEAWAHSELHEGNPHLRLALLLAPVEALTRQSKFSAALRQATQALQLAEALNDAREIGYCQRMLGLVYFLSDDSIRSQQHMQTALMLARQNHDLALEADAVRYLGVMFSDLGNRVQGEAYLVQALRLQRLLGNSAQEQALLVNLGVSRVDQNDMVAGVAYLKEALALVDKTGSRLSESRIENALGFSLAALGDFETALQHHERSRQIAHDCGEHVQESHALHNLCSVNRKLHRLAQAEDCGHESLRLAVTHGLSEAEAYAWLHLGYMALAKQQWSSAQDAFAHARGELESREHIALVIEAGCGLAAAALGQGQLAVALAHVEMVLQYKSQHAFSGTDEPLEMYLTCHRVLDAARDSRASALLAEANQLLQARRQHSLDTECKSLDLDLGESVELSPQ